MLFVFYSIVRRLKEKLKKIFLVQFSNLIIVLLLKENSNRKRINLMDFSRIFPLKLYFVSNICFYRKRFYQGFFFDNVACVIVIQFC